MKKLIAITISLALLISACFCMPLSASADAPGFDLNGWNVTNGAGGVVTPDASAQAVNFTGTQYGAMYTKVSNLEVGMTYDFSFDTSPTSNLQLWLVPGDETLTFSNGLPNNTSRQHVKTNDGTTFAAQFTAAEDSYWFVFRNETGTCTTSVFTFSNFSFAKASAEVLAGIAVANGDWNITKNASGTVTKSNNTVSFTGANSQTMYTKLTGLTANTVYKLTFDVSPTMNTQVWLLSGDAELSFTIDGTVPANATGLAEVNGTTATVEFTATEDSYYVFFRNALSTSETVAFTFSNFALESEALSEEVLAGIAVANGDWAVTQGAGGTVTKSNGTVTITGAQYQQISVPLTNLKPNTTYTLSFNHNAGDQWQFANPAYVIPGETAWTDGLNSKEGTISFGDGSCNTETSTTIRFTTDSVNTSYLVVFNCNNLTGVTVVLDNFSFSNETAYEFKGTAIRAAVGEDVKQGMRFKNYISADVIENGINGSAVVEYGSIAAKGDLDGEALVMGADGVKTGVAFNKDEGLEKTFDTDANGNKTFTAVLTGIPAEYYDEVFSVRSYVVLENGDVIYGDVQNYSVFLVFKAILDGKNTDDQAVVNAILEDEDIAANYQAWLAK